MATSERFILDFVIKGAREIDQARDKVNNLAAALTGVSFVAFISGALQAADRISDFSDATNISIASLKAMEAAMNAAGGNGKNLEKSINGLFAAIDNANGGSLAARDAFAAVGVSLADLQNLSEADILQKTLEGLSKMPPGAERAAASALLLSKSFRSVDPKQMLDALDPSKYEASAEATKQAAAAQQKLEASFKTLQEGAINALGGILKLFGEHELTVKNATTLVQGLAVAFGVLLGAQAVAAVAGMVTGIVNLNRALGVTVAISNLLGKGPLGVLLKMGAAIAGVGAGVAGLDAITKQNDEIAASAEKAAAAQESVNKAMGVKIQQATPTAGNSNRRQELDARQKAIIESDKRIAQSRAEINKSLALVNASELEKIAEESAADIAKAEAEIFAKENISRAQKAKEFAEKRLEIEQAASLKTAEVRRVQEAEINNLKTQYAQQNAQMLGQEITELDKINQLIAQQPNKYKEIGDQLRANAAIQDGEKKRIEEIIRLRALEQETYSMIKNSTYAAIQGEHQIRLNKAQALGMSQKEYAILKAKNEEIEKIYQLENLIAGAYEAKEMREGRISQLNQKQIDAAKTYNDLLAERKAVIQSEYQNKVLIAQTDDEMAKDFSVGWENAFNKFTENSKNAAAQGSEVFNSLTRGFGDSIVQFVQTGKLSFRSLFNDLIAQAVRASANRLLMSILGSMGGSSGGGGFFSSLFGGFRAEGGPVSAGTPYVVGEKGPELFLPKSAGTIIPNGAAIGGGGGVTNVNYSIQAVDASSFRSLVARDPEFIFNVTEQGRRNLPGRSRR